MTGLHEQLSEPPDRYVCNPRCLIRVGGLPKQDFELRYPVDHRRARAASLARMQRSDLDHGHSRVCTDR